MEDTQHMSFIDFLLKEQTDDEGIYVKLNPKDIRDPNKRRDAMRAKQKGQNKNIRRKQLLQKKKDIDQKLREL